MKSKKSPLGKKTAASPRSRGVAALQPKSPAKISRRKSAAKSGTVGSSAATAPPAPQIAAPEPEDATKIPGRKAITPAEKAGQPPETTRPSRKRAPRKLRSPAQISRRKTAAKPVKARTSAVAAPPAPQTAAPESEAAAKTPGLKTIAQAEAAEPSAFVAPPPRARETTPKIPPILLEEDKPAAASAGGPGQRYALGPTPPKERLEPEGELPEAYGTQQLLLVARDPHWLYAHWDLTREQQRRYNSLSADRHLVLRVHIDAAGARPVAEVHVHPESRHWFVHVNRAGTRYVCELGFYTTDGEWVTISTSGVALTPPDAMSQETAAEFATVPYELPLPKLVSLVKEAARENVPLASALEELRAQGHPELPGPETPPPPAEWTPAQEHALAELVNMDSARRVWMGSLEITELIRRQFVQDMASLAASQFGAPAAPGSPGAISSPGGAAPEARGFWFNVNAELIVYGATEPTATVTIGGRIIKLRPDGSFSYRFALPDGEYELPVVAVSADQTDGRAAELQFSRGTEYRGDVGASPQDPELKRPEPGNV